jgi:hypothetical protein
MSKMVRRFEVLLPLRFNDGTSVPDALIADTLLELETQFGAVSSRPKRYAAAGALKVSVIGTTSFASSWTLLTVPKYASISSLQKPVSWLAFNNLTFG